MMTLDEAKRVILSVGREFEIEVVDGWKDVEIISNLTPNQMRAMAIVMLFQANNNESGEALPVQDDFAPAKKIDNALPDESLVWTIFFACADVKDTDGADFMLEEWRRRWRPE